MMRNLIVICMLWLALPARAVLFERPGGGGSGGTGGVVSNEVKAATIATFYTNTTPHYVEGVARLGTSTAGHIQCSVTNSANVVFHQFQSQVSTAGAGSNSVVFKVPPGGWYKFIGLTTTAVDGSQALTYYATNGSVSYAATAGNAATATAAQTAVIAGADTHTNLYGRYTPQHMNLDRLSVVRSLLISNLCPLVEIHTDNSFNIEQSLIPAITNWSKLNGSGGNLAGLNLYFYSTWNSLGTFYTSDGDNAFYPAIHFGLANGGAVTNISASAQGWATTTIRVRGWKENNLGTLGVYTNAYGATPALLTTIDCDNGGAMAAYSTNFYLGEMVTNCVVSVRSVGSNIVMDIGQWNTNRFAGIVWHQVDAPHLGFDPYFNTAAKSNYLRTFLTGVHGVIMSDLAGSNGLYTGTMQFNSMRTNMGEPFDLIVHTPVAPTNDIPEWLDEREGLQNAARDTGVGLIDLTPYFLDLQKISVFGWMTDITHALQTGTPSQRYLGPLIADALHWSWSDMSRFGWTNYTLQPGTPVWVNVPLNGVKAVQGSVLPTILASGNDTGSPFYYDVGWAIGSGGSCSFRAALPYGSGYTRITHRVSFQSDSVNWWTNSIYTDLRYDRTTGRALGSTADTRVAGGNNITTVYMTNFFSNDTDLREAIIAVNAATNPATRYFIGWDYWQQ